MREHDGETHPLRRQPRRARRRRSSSICREYRGARAGRADRRLAVPAGRRAALPAHAAGLRLLLVPAGRARPRRRAGTSAPPSPAGVRHARAARRAGEALWRAASRASSSATCCPTSCRAQRWFGGKDARIVERRARITLGCLGRRRTTCSLIDVERRRPSGETQRYFLPLSRAVGRRATCSPARPSCLHAGRLRRGPRASALCSTPAHDERFAARRWSTPMRGGASLARRRRQLVFDRRRRLRGARCPPAPGAHALGAEQSNVSLIVDERGDAEALPPPARRRAARDRDGAVPHRGAGFANTPALLGSVEHARRRRDSRRRSRSRFEFVRNQGDAWR